MEWSLRGVAGAPISEVTLSLNGYDRKLTVGGASLTDVVAFHSSLTHQLDAIGSDWGTHNQRNLVLPFYGFVVFGVPCFYFIAKVSDGEQVKENAVRLILWLFFAFLTFLFPWSDMLSGFAVYPGEVSLLVRYSGGFTVAGFVVSIVNFALLKKAAEWVVARLFKEPQKVKPSPPTKRARIQ